MAARPADSAPFDETLESEDEEEPANGKEEGMSHIEEPGGCLLAENVLENNDSVAVASPLDDRSLLPAPFCDVLNIAATELSALLRHCWRQDRKKEHAACWFP